MWKTKQYSNVRFLLIYCIFHHAIYFKLYYPADIICRMVTYVQASSLAGRISEDMKAWEDERFNAGQVRFIHGLLASYIERDSWTKLNVKPSKIFQQDAVLDELFSHASKTAGDSSTAQVHKYLHALSKMFERGLLSK